MRNSKLYILFILIVLFCSCRSSNIQTDSKINIAERLESMQRKMDSLQADYNRTLSYSSEMWSDVCITSTTTQYSAPDSAGNQYKQSVTTTRIDGSSRQLTTANDSTASSLQQSSQYTDSLSQSTDRQETFQQQTETLSWWDKYKTEIYGIIAFVLVMVVLFANRKRLCG